MEVFIYVALSVACGAWAASICEKKGRHELLGWALGLVLGLIGVLVAWLLPPSTEYREWRARVISNAEGWDLPPHTSRVEDDDR